MRHTMSIETAASPQPIAIAVAPNGGRRTKQDHPAVPVTASELSRDAAACLEAGAAMIHVHVRDPKGAHLLDASAYEQAIEAIRAAVGDRLIVQITTEALGAYSPGEQIAVVKEVRPEAVSLALRELAPGDGHESNFADFMLWLKQERIVPQIILYEPEEAVRLDGMRSRGLIPWQDVPVLYVLGRYKKGQVSVPADLLPFLAPDMPHFNHWSVCAFGRHEAACASAAALLGGHVRVGFENNLWLPGGQIAPSNAALLRAVAEPMTLLEIKSQDAFQLRAALEYCLAG
jgi:3-keto-5-aminohexanoate cleavage enzyme